ncbi:type I pantothenate kinase [Bacillaceae bacterium Marseille-Q3522]|nr:type I pantothenate kinase [Bacillaceae bacterium Marseille-Q3522]
MTIDSLSLNRDTYTAFSRKEWSNFGTRTAETLSLVERQQLQGVNETISEAEVKDIYLPVSQLLAIYANQEEKLHTQLNRFLHREIKKVPFVIGIAGSVSVGKSTTARLIQALIRRWPMKPKVELITTDGFLYPNTVLEARGLMKRKGFPESYDIRQLIRVLSAIKSGCAKVEVPVYSHYSYDITTERQTVIEPDIVIVEGINVLQVNKRELKNRQIFVSDFFDFSIYVDAEEKDIINWYIERFKLLRNTAFQSPESFFYRYRELTDAEITALAINIWETINSVNLVKNILPTRNRADMIITKGEDHSVQEVLLRKR